MFVKECMSKNKVVVGSPSMKLHEVAKKMRDGDFGILPIAENDRLIGMLTDRDIVVRAISEGKDPKQTTASEVMSKSVYYCYDDQTLEEVLKNLGDQQIRRLPVMNRQKRLVGMLSLGDLAKSHASSEKFEETLGRISATSQKEQTQVQ